MNEVPAKQIGETMNEVPAKQIVMPTTTSIKKQT